MSDIKNKLVIFHLDDGKELRGGQRQVLYLAKELNLLNYENFIVCRKNSPLEKESLKRNINTITLPYFFEWDILSAWKLQKKIKIIAQKNRPDPIFILHSHTSHTAAISYLTSLFIPCLRITHRRMITKTKKDLSSRLKYIKSDAVIAISNAIKQIMTSAQIPEKKISVVHSSIDLKELPFDIKDFENYKKMARQKISENFQISQNSIWIGSLIALVPHKDPENFLKSAKLVLEKYPQTQFILAGNGILKNRMHRLIKELNVDKNFHLLGYYNNPYELLSSFDIFVLPSCEEGMGSILLEAMCARLPIIATEAGGIPEIIENDVNGLIVRKKNPEELAKGQIALIENEELRKKLSENGFKKIPEFSSKKMAELTLKVYEKTIENFKHTGHSMV